jgi:hypothetical protein
MRGVCCHLRQNVELQDKTNVLLERDLRDLVSNGSSVVIHTKPMSS